MRKSGGAGTLHTGKMACLSVARKPLLAFVVLYNIDCGKTVLHMG